MANTKIPSELIADNSVGITQLNVSDGTNGQVLTTNGSGTLSFSTISGYTDSDVETYLNTSEIYTDPTNNYLGVGSGASTPSHVFHVQKSVASGTLVKLQNASNTASDVLLLNTAGTGSGTNILDVQASGSSKFLVRGDGNIGIGTTSPESTFEVKTNDASGNRLGFIGDGATTGSALWTNWTTGDSYLDFRLGGTSSTYTKMRIDNSGRVGIGTSSPSRKFVVKDTTTAHIKLTESGLGESVTDGLDMVIDYTGTGYLINRESASLHLGTSNTNRLSIDSAGDVTVQKNIQLSSGQTIRSNTDTGTRFHTHLATCSGYSGTGCVVLNTNIPSYDVTGNAMFSIRIEGFAYDNTGGGLIDMQVGSYSGEGNWHNVSYTAQNIPDQWIGRIRIGKDSNNKTVIIFGHTNTSINYEIAVTNFIQGFSGLVQSYAEGWTFTKDVTSLAAYSNIAEVYPKEVNKIGFQCRTNGSTFTSGSWTTISGTIASAVTDWNFGGYLNESTGKFLPKVPGWYTFRCGGWASHNIASNNDRYAFSFSKNGSRVFIGGGNFSSGDTPISTHSQTMYLNGTTDYVNLELFQASSGTWGTGSHNFWYQGFLENHGARGAYDLTIGN